MDLAGGIAGDKSFSVVADGDLGGNGRLDLERSKLLTGDIPEAGVAVTSTSEEAAIGSETGRKNAVRQFAVDTTWPLGRMGVPVGDAAETAFGVPPDQSAIFTAGRQHLAVTPP